MFPCDVSVIVLMIGSGAGPVGSPWLWRFVVQDFVHLASTPIWAPGSLHFGWFDSELRNREGCGSITYTNLR